MTCFIATLKIKPGHEAEFERLQAELSQLTHESEPDTMVYDIIRSRDTPDTYVVYARFKDEAAFQLHQTRRSTNGWCRRSSPPSPATWTSSSSITSPDGREWARAELSRP